MKKSAFCYIDRPATTNETHNGPSDDPEEACVPT